MSYREDSRYGSSYADDTDKRYEAGTEGGYDDDRDRDNPRAYINTGKSIVLAIDRLLIALGGIALLVLLIVNLTRSSRYVTSTFGSVFSSLGAGGSLSTVDAVAVITLIVLFILIVGIIINGIGAFLLRVAKHGATCVQIAQIMFAVLAMSYLALQTYLLVKSFIDAANLASKIHQDFWKVLFGSGRGGDVALLIFFTISDTVLLLMLVIASFNYHISVAKVMAHTRRELSQNRLMPLYFTDKLGGRSIFLMVVSGIYITLRIVYVLMITGGYAGSGIGTAIGVIAGVLVLLYLRLIFVLLCDKDFNRVHSRAHY